MEPIVVEAPLAISLPAFDELHEYISRLDFYKDLRETEQSIKRNIEYDDVGEPPSLEKQDSANNIPLKFLTETSYVDVWKRLFLYEARAQILKAKLEESRDSEKVEFVVSEEIKPFRYFTFKRVNTFSKTAYSNGSLVMLSPDPILDDKPVDHLLGFIDSNDEIRVKLIFDETFQQKQPEKWAKFDSTKDWNIKLLCAITTVEREYRALERFRTIDPTIRKTILNPLEYLNCKEEKFHIPHELDQRLKQIYNDSQYRAMHECLKKMGVTLIQGPPGTGKTRTVLGTLSVLTNSFNKLEEPSMEIEHAGTKHDASLFRKANPWFDTGYVDWRDQTFMDLPLNLHRFQATREYVKSSVTDRQIILTKKHENVPLPGKILICGPSNAAVDEIIRKVLAEGLLDSHGKRFDPQLVRVGDNFDQSLENVSLEYLASQELVRNQKEDIVFYRNKILRNSKIICATLSAAGHQFIESSGLEFDTVVVDEACQAVEVSTLIPLIYGCKRLILIGDPNQLPSTVFSRMCIKQGYDQSLFERMMKCGLPVNMLRTQYRMHPDISKVIGNVFYGGLLQDSPSVVNELIKNPIYKTFPPFMFIHVPRSSEIKFKRSFRNVVEGKVVRILGQMLKDYGCTDVGVLSPYSQQINYLESLQLPKCCEIKTIDSFQGREKSVIIFNTVRAGLRGQNKRVHKNKKKTIGFLSDRRRINVGLSRAKHVCFVVGDAQWLSRFDTWRDIINQAVALNQLYEYQDGIKEFGKKFTENHRQFLRNKL